MLNTLLPRQGLFPLTKKHTDNTIKNFLIVGNLASATLDLYFRSRSEQMPDYTEFDSQENDNWDNLFAQLSENTCLILVRDVPISLLKKLAKQRNKPASIVWFIDDDIPASGTDKTLPKAYKKRLENWYRKAWPHLSGLCNNVWVSTPYLAEKYGLAENAVLPPVDLKKTDLNLVRCFYHGSSSHQQEWVFVIEFIKQAQQRFPDTWFELIGDHSLYKQLRNVPRINILHPMQWQNYLAMTSSRSMDIGLVPLFDSPFNLARSHCKLLDITRQNAVGIYSELVAYSNEIGQMNAGIVVANKMELWLEALAVLLQKDRDVMLGNAQHLIKHIIPNTAIQTLCKSNLTSELNQSY
jgi:hypothetical protein